MGGPLTLALDVTDTTAPKFLWEHVDASDSSAIGYTTGRPAVGNIYDVSDSSSPVDRYVAFWGSGRAVPISLDSSYYKATEGNLYMWALEMITTKQQLPIIKVVLVMVLQQGITIIQKPMCMVLLLMLMEQTVIMNWLISLRLLLL